MYKVPKKKIVSVNFGHALLSLLDLLILGDGLNMLSRNVVTELPHCAS